MTELQTLRALVAQFSKTRDGVTIVPRMVVYVPHFDGKVHAVQVHSVGKGFVVVTCSYQNQPAPMGNYAAEDCYSQECACPTRKKYDNTYG